MKSGIHIIADLREKNSGVAELLEKMGVYIIFRMLDVGDYIISDTIAIERKNVRDFVRSIYDGRLFDQVSRLKETYEKSVIIVEGDIARTLLEFPKVNSLYGALVKLALEIKLPVLFTPNKEHTAYLIHRIALREQGHEKKPIVIRRKRKLESLRDWQLYIVESLPGVGPKLAERLLRHFGSIRRIFEASSVELSKVEGLGESRAREIFRIINAPFEKAKRHKVQSRLRFDNY